MSPLSNHPVRPDRVWRSQAAMNEPRDVDLGQFDYQARAAFRDLCRLHGFEAARQQMAEIINSEAERTARG